MTPRRFPPRWSVEDTGTGSAFAVVDACGQKLAYVYYEEEPGRRSAAKMLTKDERGGLRRTWRSFLIYCGAKALICCDFGHSA